MRYSATYYGPHITAEQYQALADANVTEYDLTTLTTHCEGMSRDDVIALAVDGVRANHVAHALAHEVPVDQWTSFYRGWDERWIDRRTGSLEHGMTLAGWDEAALRASIDRGETPSACWTPDAATVLHDSPVPPQDAAKWHAVVTERYWHPVVWDADTARVVLAVIDQGIRRSHVALYDQCGCRSIRDVSTALAHGVTPDVVASLRDTRRE